MKELMQKLVKRIKPKNGMAVNDMVWQEAHDYHRFHQQAHALFGHGSGILTGLEVRAEQSGSRRVWIQPGIAVDPQGQFIILEEQHSKGIGSDQEGLVYLFVVGAGESDFNEGGGSAKSKKGPDRVRDGYVIENALTLPNNAVELARIRLSSRDAEIKDAKSYDLPGVDEIDMRFRREVGANSRPIIGMAISYVGQSTPESLPKYGPRVGYLARSLSHLTSSRLWIYDDVPLAAGFQPYQFVYLIEQGPSNWSPAEIEGLKSFLQKGGGTLFIESYWPQGGETIGNVLKSANINLVEIPAEHPLLNDPFLFSAPPAGTFNGPIRAADGVVFSARRYGHLWQKQPYNGQPVSRDEIRTSMEWWANMIVYTIRYRCRYPDRLKG